jgi:hypothetical protein
VDADLVGVVYGGSGADTFIVRNEDDFTILMPDFNEAEGDMIIYM